MTVPTGNYFDKYGSSNAVFRRIMMGFFAALDRALPADSPGTVVEVGMGEGEVAERLRARWPSTPVIGLDLPDDQLGSDWTAKGLSGCYGDAARLPFATGSAGLVLAIEVLEHVDDPRGALAEISRVAAGPVVLSVPNEPIWRMANMARGKYLGALGNTPGHVQHWSTSRFVGLVSDHLDVLQVQRPFPWTMVAARARR